MKRIFAAVLTLLLATSLVACGGDKNTSSAATESQTASTAESAAASVNDNSEANSETSSTEGSSYYDETAGRYVIPFEPVNYEGKTFSVLVRGASADTYQSNDFTTDSELYGDVLNNAVAERNQYVADNYGVELVIYKNDTINDDIRTDVQAGTRMYDIIMPTLPFCATLAQEGNLYDLSKLENMDFDAPWWDSNATESFSIGGSVYFTCGDITILNKVNTSSILFNKDLLEQLKLDDPYTLVANNTWTYDKMMEMAKAATQELDGDGTMTGSDQWGMLAAYNDSLTFFGGAGQTICKKDAEDYPYLSMTDERSLSILQTIITDMIEPGTWVIYAQNFADPIWTTSLAAFNENRVLFRPSAFSATTKLRKLGCNFGIVPQPKWNADQDDYRSYCGTGETAGFAISIGCADPEFSAYMASVYACEAKNFITPAYMEINLKGKDAQDDESLEMLNIIFDNIVYDVGECYNFGSIKQQFGSFVSASNNNVASTLDSLKDSINTAIETTVESFQALS